MNNPFRALSTGDLHVDEQSPRFDECQRILAWIVDTVEGAKGDAAYDVVLITGDVYERRSTPRERLIAARLIQRCANVCPVVIVKGNHDRKLDLKILRELGAEFPIYVVEDCEVVTIVSKSGVHAKIACMAWPSRTDVTNDGAARDAIRTVLSDLGNVLDAHDGPKILLGHFDVSGAKVGEGQPVIGGAITLGIEDLGLARAHATVMGHIHRAQQWLFDARPILYCGSPARHDFGEPEEKSILHLEIDGDRVSWERIQTPARGMVLVEAEWLPDGLGFGAINDTHPNVEAMVNADVRFRYTVAKEHQDAALRGALDISEAWKRAGAATVKIEDVLQVVTRAREAAIAVSEARSTEDQLEAMWSATGNMPEPLVKERLFRRLAEISQAVS